MIYIAFLFFTLFIFAIAFYQWQYFMIFSPKYFRDGELDGKYEILSLTTDDGVELEGVVYKPQSAKSTLLFFAGRSHDSVGLIQRLASEYKQTRIIAFNYRSYGRSEGRADEKNILKDGVKIAEIVQKNYGDFYILGFSLGASVASFVATKHKTLGLFLVGAFDSISSMAKERFHINLSFLLRYRFDNSAYVKNIDAPTYLFSSKSDEIVYIQNAINLKKCVKNLVLFKELDGLSHKELLWDREVIDKINEVVS